MVPGRPGAGFEQTDRLWRLHLASAVPLLIVGALLLARKSAGAKLISVFSARAPFPEKAISVLTTPETRHIFAIDQWGDYLIYRLYPSKQVFIDGRSDFYGDKFGEHYLDLTYVKYGWEKTLDQYDIDTILLSPNTPLATTLKISRDWRVVYDDGFAVVFRRAATGQSRIPSSLVSSNGGSIRDRAITKTITHDRKITQPTNIEDDTPMKNMFMNFVKDEQGQDLIEYTLLMAFIALASAAIFTNAGKSISQILTTASTQLSNAATQQAS